MPDEAELHPAYVWDCDACGTENFVRATVFEITPEEREELGDGQWTTTPDFVCCRVCGREYRAVDFREDTDNTHENTD